MKVKNLLTILAVALVAFGGAGPLHGAEVAAMLGIPEVIVPPYPGITSAMGLLTTDLKYDAIRTAFQLSTAIDLLQLNADLLKMEEQLTQRFEVDRIPTKDIAFVRDADMRYVGQGYELKVPLPAGKISEAGLVSTWATFHAMHKREYGHAFEANPIEVVNIRVSGLGRMPKIRYSQTSRNGRSLAAAKVKSGQCLFRVEGKLRAFDTQFYRRHSLPVDIHLAGPAIVLQQDSTTVIPPSCTAVVDAAGNLIISIGGRK